MTYKKIITESDGKYTINITAYNKNEFYIQIFEKDSGTVAKDQIIYLPPRVTVTYLFIKSSVDFIFKNFENPIEKLQSMDYESEGIISEDEWSQQILDTL